MEQSLDTINLPPERDGNMLSLARDLDKRFESTRKSMKMQGMLILDFFQRFGEAYQYLSKLFKEGKLKNKSTIVEGFDNVPNALAAIFDGANTGKMLVKF